MLEAFFLHTITPLAFLDQSFDFVRVNGAYAQADGKTPKFFVGKNYFTLYPDAEMRGIFERAVRPNARILPMPARSPASGGRDACGTGTGSSRRC